MEIKKFRNPRLANYEGERMIGTEVMQESCDDLIPFLIDYISLAAFTKNGNCVSLAIIDVE